MTSFRGLPPAPSGENPQDLYNWALRMFEFLTSRFPAESEVAPTPVLLQHQTGPLERADPDGILMWDPIRQQVVYSDDGIWKIFGSTGSLSYLVTDNAGDGTPAGDINNTDFTGQQGAVGACAQCPTGTAVSFYHKGVQYVYAGPTPASYGLGCADTMDPSYLIASGVGDHGQLTGLLNDDHPQYLTEARGDARYYLQPQVDGLVEARLRWRRAWLQQTYEQNDVVLDQGAGTYWTMVANKQTAQRAAPQADDDPQYSQPEVPNWVTNQYTGVVESGMNWTANQPIILIGYQVWVPTLSANTNYVIRTFAYSEPDQSDIIFREISEPLLIEGGWTTIAVQRNLIFSGTTIGIRINALNSGADTIVGPFDWGREGNSNNANPAAGNWNRRNQNNIVRIHEVDDGGTNRGPNGDGSLEGIIAGSTIQIVNQTDATESATYTTTGAATYGGGVYEFPVEISDTGVGGEPPVGAICAITITVPIPSPTDYVEADPSEDTLGGIGFLELDGVPQAGADAKSYGVRVLVDTITVSTDWDIMSWVGSGGGGGGGGEGGVTDFISLTDTPVDYANAGSKFVAVNQGATALEFVDGPQVIATVGSSFPLSPTPGALHYLTVEVVGLYVYYDDGDSLQWVQTN